MRDWQSQAHVKHYCRYHIVFVPKYRKKTIYGVLRKEIASYLPNIRLIITDVVVEDTAIDLYVAIDRAADRAGRTVRRKIDRRQTLFRDSRSLVFSEA